MLIGQSKVALFTEQVTINDVVPLFASGRFEGLNGFEVFASLYEYGHVYEITFGDATIVHCFGNAVANQKPDLLASLEKAERQGVVLQTGMLTCEVGAQVYHLSEAQEKLMSAADSLSKGMRIYDPELLLLHKPADFFESEFGIPLISFLRVYEFENKVTCESIHSYPEEEGCVMMSTTVTSKLLGGKKDLRQKANTIKKRLFAASVAELIG